MKTKLHALKDKFRQSAPTILPSIVFGAATATYIVHRSYNPKDKVAVQIPEKAWEMMKDGKGLAFNSHQGWFTLNYYPEQ